jgi:hypothetical protein
VPLLTIQTTDNAIKNAIYAKLTELGTGFFVHCDRITLRETISDQDCIAILNMARAWIEVNPQASSDFAERVARNIVAQATLVFRHHLRDELITAMLNGIRQRNRSKCVATVLLKSDLSLAQLKRITCQLQHCRVRIDSNMSDDQIEAISQGQIGALFITGNLPDTQIRMLAASPQVQMMMPERQLTTDQCILLAQSLHRSPVITNQGLSIEQLRAIASNLKAHRKILISGQPAEQASIISSCLQPGTRCLIHHALGETTIARLAASMGDRVCVYVDTAMSECKLRTLAKNLRPNTYFSVGRFCASSRNYGNLSATQLDVAIPCLRSGVCVYPMTDLTDEQLSSISSKLNPSVVLLFNAQLGDHQLAMLSKQLNTEQRFLLSPKLKIQQLLSIASSLPTMETVIQIPRDLPEALREAFISAYRSSSRRRHWGLHLLAQAADRQHALHHPLTVSAIPSRHATGTFETPASHQQRLDVSTETAADRSIDIPSAKRQCLCLSSDHGFFSRSHVACATDYPLGAPVAQSSVAQLYGPQAEFAQDCRVQKLDPRKHTNFPSGSSVAQASEPQAEFAKACAVQELDLSYQTEPAQQHDHSGQSDQASEALIHTLALPTQMAPQPR